MARAIHKLSSAAVEKRKTRGRLGDGGGLWLNVATTGSKSWVFRWTRTGKPAEIGLGPYPALSLAKARVTAAECRALVAEGLDPSTDRTKETAKTFGQVAELYLNEMASRWSNAKTQWQWQRSLTVSAKPLHSKPINLVDTSDILKVLKPIWQKTPESASRLRMRLEHVLDFARARGWRDTDNPARWRGHLSALLPARDLTKMRHHPAMPWQDVPEFFDRLIAVDSMSAKALAFTILTAARTGETLGARISEFDLEARTWSIPAERMKMSRAHVVPLSDAAVEIVQPLLELATGEFVFPGQKPKKPLSNMSMEMVLRRMKVEGVTVHGFRSSFRDWAGDQTTFEREVAEAALSHQVGNAVERSYRRGSALEKRRRLMEAWASYCCIIEANEGKSSHG